MMVWEIVGTDHLKARCVCEEVSQDHCPLHQVPVIVYQAREVDDADS